MPEGSREEMTSTAILTLLSVIFVLMFSFFTVYCYLQWNRRREKEEEFGSDTWLNLAERKPLIPGQFHAQTIQPCEEDEDKRDIDSLNGADFEDEKDQNAMGRIIFVMRYNRKREELMVRLVQIEGLPLTQQIYSPNSAYVDVQLKYVGHTDQQQTESRPPRLDICLQQVYYFIISERQMMAHSLEFKINTFDEQYRRFVSGVVELNLFEELADDILTGIEVVFVKDILQPSVVPALDKEDEAINDEDSDAESGLSLKWEDESKELSTNSLLRYNSEHDLLAPPLQPLSEEKRAHSIGYLASYEWTVKEIDIDDDQPTLELNVAPTPESFYHIVPDAMSSPISNSHQHHGRFAYKKQPKLRRMASVRRSTPKHPPALQRSFSCPRDDDEMNGVQKIDWDGEL